MERNGRSEPPAEGRRFDLGVLLVHGIGESRRGETITAWGQALLGCIGDWLGPVGLEARIERARLDDGGASDEPAHAEVRLRPPVGRGPRLAGAEWDASRRWLLAEGWWAQSFPPPSYRELAAWSLGVLPWTFTSHFDRGFRRALYRLRRPSGWPGRVYHLLLCGVEFLRLAGALLLLPLLLALLLLVVVLGLIPGPLRNLAVGVQRILSAYVGDSFMLVGNEVAAGAIYDRVIRDLGWLAKRCDRVAILAHSQGAAVSHQVLRTRPGARCDLLITFGSGLRKLSEIRQAERAEGGRGPILLAICGTWLAGVGGALAWFPSPVGGDRWTGVGIGVIGLLTTILATGRWRGRTLRSTKSDEQGRYDRQTFDERFRLLDPRTRWVDVYASADLVPNGPLLDSLLPAEMESYEVYNRASALSDHTTYLKSRDDFVWGTANALLAATGFEWSEVEARPGEAEAGEVEVPGGLARRAAHVRRSWRVLWNRLFRGLTLLVPWLLLRVWRRQVPSPLAGVLETVHRWLAQVTPLAADEPPAGLASYAGVALLVTAFFVVRAVGDALWAWWDRAESKRALRGRPARWWEPPGLLLAALWLALVEAAVRTFPLPRPVPWSLVVLLLLFFLSWLFTGLGTANPIRHLQSLAGAGDAAEMLRVWQEAEKRRLEREGRAGRHEALLELGWSKQERAKREARSAAELEQALTEAEELYERVLAAGDSTAGWYLGPLRELRLQRFQESERGRGRGAAGEEAALREAVIDAYRRAVEIEGSEPGLRLPLARHLQQQGGDGWRRAEEVLRQGSEAGDAECRLELARSLRRRGLLEEARGELERALEGGTGEPHLELGRLAERSGDLVGAAAHYRQALAAGVQAAAESLAHLLVAGGRLDEAVAALLGGVELGSADAALALGRLRLKRGEREAARAAFERVFSLAPDGWQVDQATRALARQRAQDGDPEGAERVYLDAAARHRSASSAIELGSLRRRRADLEGAASAFRVALEMARGRQESYAAMRAARCLAELPVVGDDGAALTVLAKEDADAARELGELRQRQGDPEAACAAFRRAVDLASAGRPWSGAPAAVELARLLAVAQKPDEAEELVDTALDRFGAVGAYEVGLLRDDQRDARRAIAAYRRSLRLSRLGDDALASAAVQGLVRVYEGCGRFRRAERLLRAGMEVLGAPELATDLARLLAEGGEVESATRVCRRAVELARTARRPFPRAVLLAAELLASSGAQQEADELLTRHVDEMGHDVAFALGELRARGGRLDEALEAYRRAAGLAAVEDVDPDRALVAQAEIHRQRGEGERAEELLLLALQAAPSARTARQLAALRAESGRYDAAVEAYRRALDMARAEDDGYEASSVASDLADLHLSQGDGERAEATLAGVVRAFPSARCALRLAELQAELGRPDEAIEGYRAVIGQAGAERGSWQEESARLDLAALLASRGRLDEAVETLTGYLDGAGGRGSVQVGLQLARLHERRGDEEAALDACRSVLSSSPGRRDGLGSYWFVPVFAEAIALCGRLSRQEEADRLVEEAAEKLDEAALVDLGRALAADDAERALLLYRRVIDGGGVAAERERAALAAADLLHREGEQERAAEVLATAIDELGSAAAALEAARRARRSGDLATARTRFTEAAELARRGGDEGVAGEATLGLAEVESEAGREAESRKLLDRVGRETASAETLLDLGWSLQRRGDATAARQAFERAVVLARAGDDAALRERALRALATVAREGGDEAAAIEVLREAVAETRSVEAASALGELLARRGETLDAVEAHETALSLARRQPSNQRAEHAALALARLLVETGERRRAMRILWRAADGLGSAAAARELATVLDRAGLAEPARRWERRAEVLREGASRRAP